MYMKFSSGGDSEEDTPVNSLPNTEVKLLKRRMKLAYALWDQNAVVSNSEHSPYGEALLYNLPYILILFSK